MDNESIRNLVIATVLSLAIMIMWQLFVIGPQQQQSAEVTIQNDNALKGSTPSSTLNVDTHLPSVSADNIGRADIEKKANILSLSLSPRHRIETQALSGSISLKGARFDDLVLNRYKATLSDDSGNIRLLDRADGVSGFFAEFGFIDTGDFLSPPASTSLWQDITQDSALTTSKSAVLLYESDGVIFRRTISVDENYLFTIVDEIKNNRDGVIKLHPYARVVRGNLPKTSGFFILHEGLIGVLGDKGLQEIDYDDLLESNKISFSDNKGGFTGITDKYWAAILIPPQDKRYNADYSYYRSNNQDYFQADYLLESVSIEPNSSTVIQHNFLAGSKVVDIIDAYQLDLGINNFDLLIDWGWFYFITKPLFNLLQFFATLIGNFGVAILLVTVCLKVLFLPLANKSYVSMSRMKKFQPEVSAISSRYKDNRAEAQRQIMALYKKHKINPMSGCFPILLQIPVFFALYKVLFVTIEMRHAPFFGWIQDLSAPDPTNMFNLFGLLPYTLPDFLTIGLWPIVMGISMFIQMRLNPAPTDPIQARVFAFMPLFFTILLASFPAGLVIYWTWNNFLSILQQYFIMRRQGVEVDIIGNTLAVFGRKRGDKNGGGNDKVS